MQLRPHPCRPGDLFPGADHTADEIEFLRAIDRHKWERHCPHPRWPEVLALLRQLGSRKGP